MQRPNNASSDKWKKCVDHNLVYAGLRTQEEVWVCPDHKDPQVYFVQHRNIHSRAADGNVSLMAKFWLRDRQDSGMTGQELDRDLNQLELVGDI